MFTMDDVSRATHKHRPVFYKVLYPIVKPLTWVIVNYTNISANFVTLVSFIFVIASTILFVKGLFLYGSVCFLIRCILDNADGRIARLRNQASKFGALFDNITGYLASAMCTIALVYTLNPTIIVFLVPFVVIMSVIHPVQHIIVMLLLKETREREFLEFMSFEDVRLLAFVLVPLLPYVMQIKAISLLPVLILTVSLFSVKQLTWFVYYYNEFNDYII